MFGRLREDATSELIKGLAFDLLVEFGDVVNDTLPLVVDTRLLKVVFKGDVKVEAAAFQNEGIGIALVADNSS